MARLVSVYHESEGDHFERRQLPLVIDETLTMVMQLQDSSLTCTPITGKNKNADGFENKLKLLSKDELSSALSVSSKDLFAILSQAVPCVGCRRSVERLFLDLVESGHPALEPLIVTRNKQLSVCSEYQKVYKSLSALFYIQGPKLASIVDQIPKSRKNRRCLLHSLDLQRSRPLGNWIDIWDLMSKQCREEVVLIESELLLATLETYLLKHRFCMDCRQKVVKAFHILIGEVDGAKEKGYTPALYGGIRCCPPEKHVHVKCDTGFIGSLVSRAEPELMGRYGRERHAKTIEVAQEEVLTCLGICLFERLHRIQQRLHEEEQCWQLLFSLGVDALRKNVQLALEKKQGISQLELICAEIESAEVAKREKKEQKKLRKKKKRNKKLEDGDEGKENICENEVDEEQSEERNDTPTRAPETPSPPPPTCDTDTSPKHETVKCLCDVNKKRGRQRQPHPPVNPIYKRSVSPMSGLSDFSPRGTPERMCLSCNGELSRDCGYSSAHSNESAGSCEGSEIACSDGFCSHDGICTCTAIHLDDDLTNPRTHSPALTNHRADNRSPTNGRIDNKKGISLKEMLENSDQDDQCFIPDSEIQQFQARAGVVSEKRAELRQTLQARFQQMCMKK